MDSRSIVSGLFQANRQGGSDTVTSYIYTAQGWRISADPDPGESSSDPGRKHIQGYTDGIRCLHRERGHAGRYPGKLSGYV